MSSSIYACSIFTTRVFHIFFYFRFVAGIFGADGHQWKWQRKLASHIFNVKSFRSYTSSVFCKEADLVIDYLNLKADRGEVVDLQDVFYKYTLGTFFCTSSAEKDASEMEGNRMAILTEVANNYSNK